MPSIESISEECNQRMQHDELQPNCIGCPNVVEETTELDRKVMRCTLSEFLNSDRAIFVRDKVASNDHTISFKASRMTARGLKAILDGEHIVFQEMTMEEEGVDSSASLDKKLHIDMGDGKGEQNLVGDFVSELNDVDVVVWRGTTKIIEEANDGCPIVEGYIEQVSSRETEADTELTHEDPIIHTSTFGTTSPT